MAVEYDKAQRVRALKIYEMLCQDSDEENPMTTARIIAKLERDGIECNRKTLYKDIDSLNDYGFEVMCTREQINKYYVVSRKFDIPELRILIDAVQAASFITPSKTKELIDKIASLGGSSRGKVLKNTTAFNTVNSTVLGNFLVKYCCSLIEFSSICSPIPEKPVVKEIVK